MKAENRYAVSVGKSKGRKTGIVETSIHKL